MALAANGGVAFTPSDGTKRSLDYVPMWEMRAVADAGGGSQSFFVDGYCLRTGQIITGLFPTGANGIIGQTALAAKGRTHIFYDNSASNNKDFFSLLHPRIRLVQPTVNISTPIDCWEIEADLWCDTPALAPTNDIGLAFHCNCSTTGYPGGLTGGGALGDPGYAGFGVFFDTATAGDIRLKGRNQVGNVPLTGNVLIDGSGAANFNKWIRFTVRLESARVGVPAQMSIFLDNVLKRVEQFTVGSTLLPDININAWNLGVFRAFLRCSSGVATANVLRCSHFRIGAASSVANLIGA